MANPRTKTTILILFLLVLFSCKNQKQTSEQIQLAKAYFEMRNSADYSKIPALFTDSIITKEGSYEMGYSNSGFVDFVKWDAVFNPEYQILEIEATDGIVKAKISKSDQRILFLHEQPIVTNEILRFKGNKISAIEITDYVIFDDAVFTLNRSRLVQWIDQNHPELNGFLTDQTENGGRNYLKAIELYNAAH